MNIDLLLTEQNDTGLISDLAFKSPVAGILFDAQMRQLTLEFVDLDTLSLNIPVEDDMAEALLWATTIQIGVLENGHIQDNRQVPLMLLNDPSGVPVIETPAKPSASVTAFERFLKACVAGQPIHREDLGDEEASGSVMGGVNRALLQFAPHLARQKTLEASHELNLNGPSAPGLGGPGGARAAAPPLRQRPISSSGQHKDTSEEED